MISAYQAKQWGLVQAVELQPIAEARAYQWLASSQRGSQNALDVVMKESNEESAFEQLWWSADHRQALEKFHKS